MKNLRISFQKIVLHLFFLLAIFYSWSDVDSDTITLNTPENNTPTEVTTADILSGDASGVQFSANQGITHLSTSMGALRISRKQIGCH